LLSVILALVIVVALLSWRSYSTQKALLLQSSVDQVSQSGEQQAAQIEQWLADRLRIISSVATKLEGDMLNALQQAQASGDFQSTYFGNSDGKMFDSDPSIDHTDYNPLPWPWYQSAQKDGKAKITNTV